MFINPISDVDMHSDVLDQSDEVGMQHVGNINVLEVERSWTNPYIIDLAEIKDNDELYSKFFYLWTKKYRRKPSTAVNYINDLKRLSNDKIIPVDLLRPNPAQIITYLDHYEDSDHPYKTIDPWKAVKALYHMCGIDTTLWGYIPPSPPPSKVRIIPLPKQVKHITTHKYTTDKVKNQIVQKLLFQGFLLGLRPQEYPLIKIEDVYLDDGYLIITEPKKHQQRRQVFLEKDALVNPRRKSIKNQILLHDKINPVSPFLFIQHTGDPWTTNYLRHWVSDYVKTIFPYFTMYTMRHWCAIARLIQTKVENGTFDVWQVKEWLGHDRIETTQSYVRYAERYYRIAPFDWIKALLKSPDWWEYKGSEIENYIKQPWFRVESTGVAGYSPGQGESGVLLLHGLIKNDLSAFSISLFLFSLQHSDVMGVAG